MPNLVPLEDAATSLGVDRSTLYRYLKAGRLKRYRRGLDRRTYVDIDELEQLRAFREEPHD